MKIFLTKLHIALSVLALLAASGTGSAQKKKDTLPYGYGHTIELSGGPAWTVGGRYPVADRPVCSDGGIFNMRYSYFFGRHFGVYAGLNIENFILDSDKYFKSLDNTFRYKTSNSREYNNNIEELHTGFALGGVYRYDFGRWSLRPRVGIGYTSYSAYNFSYYRFMAEENPQHIYVNYQDNEKGYMSIEASVQICFTVGSHFFFMAEAGGMAAPAKIKYRQEIYDTRTPAPSTWTDALLETYKNRHIDTMLVSENSRSSNIGSMIYVKFGIGWNIGFNRNINNKYNR